MINMSKPNMMIFRVKENTSGVIVNIYNIPPNHNAYLYHSTSIKPGFIKSLFIADDWRSHRR